MRFLLVRCATAMGFLSVLALAAPADFTQRAGSAGANEPALSVRNAHALGIDPRSGRPLLVGGADDHAVRGDVFVWTGSRWRPVGAPGPSPRTFPAVALDQARGRLVLFGGNRVLFGAEGAAGRFLGDTWEWAGVGWAQVAEDGPSPRAEAAMAFDAWRRRVVLFGGYDREGGTNRKLGDTWEWDGARWRLAARDGPSPRNGAAMAYDERARRVVLFGGSGGPSGETWEWDGARWTKAGSIPEGRFNAAMAYDAGRRVLVRFGGWDGARRTGDTWIYEGRSWRRVATSGPAARNHAGMTYDARRRRIVLFGGHDGAVVFGDTWEWDGRRWRRVGYHRPLPRVENGH